MTVTHQQKMDMVAVLISEIKAKSTSLSADKKTPNDAYVIGWLLNLISDNLTVEQIALETSFVNNPSASITY